MPQVCRTCLEEIPDVNCIRLNNSSFKIKEELRTCLPEVDVELVPDAVMCIYCVNELHSCYDFKQKCLLTEKQIRTQLHSQVAIDLAELKRASELEQLDASDAPMDVDVSNEKEVQTLTDVEMPVNGSTADDSVNNDDDDEDEDDANFSNLVLGLCESAPRKHPPLTSPPPTTNSKPTTNSINPFMKHDMIINSARKSTTKGPRGMISPINRKLPSSSISSLNVFCSICNVTLKDLLDYIVHVKNVHKEATPNYNCPNCSFTTKGPNVLMKHYQNCKELHVPDVKSHSKNSFKCPHCNFETSVTTVLNKHIDSHILKCTKCYYIATSRESYQKHLSTHSLTLESDEVVVIDDDEDMLCDRCNHIAKGAAQYEKHCLDMHNIKYPYVCKECGYTAGSKTSLSRHSKFHTGNRMHHCSFCSYNCDLLYNLNKHLTSRHNQK